MKKRCTFVFYKQMVSLILANVIMSNLPFIYRSTSPRIFTYHTYIHIISICIQKVYSLGPLYIKRRVENTVGHLRNML